jgi:hypothetical protein
MLCGVIITGAFTTPCVAPASNELSRFSILLVGTGARSEGHRLSRCCTPRCSANEDDTVSNSDELRLARARLTEEWSAQVRKRKPRFLPFIGARQWARAMPFESEEDWNDWVEAGEKRNPYVPSRPDEVYKENGWCGWEDFLNGPIEPGEVVFQKGYKRGTWLRGPLADVKQLKDDSSGDDPDRSAR